MLEKPRLPLRPSAARSDSGRLQQPLSGDGCSRAAHDAANLLGPDLAGWVVCVSACVCPLLATPLTTCHHPEQRWVALHGATHLMEQHISPAELGQTGRRLFEKTPRQYIYEYHSACLIACSRCGPRWARQHHDCQCDGAAIAAAAAAGGAPAPRGRPLLDPAWALTQRRRPRDPARASGRRQA
jgi:hypothetical protein